MKEIGYNFNRISIVGRVFFGIRALEFLLTKEKLSNKTLNWYLDILWSYCENTINKGFWHEIMSEITPNAILYEASFELKEIRNITKLKYVELRHLFLKNPKSVNKIIDCIFVIGTANLYGSIKDDSPVTVEYCKKILQILLENNILPPSIDFLSETIIDNSGWGHPILRNTR